MPKTKSRIVVWAWYPFDELDVAETIGFDLLPNCVIKRTYYDESKADKNDYNIVIINHFFTNLAFGGRRRRQEDLAWADLVIHYTTETLIGPWKEYEQTVLYHFNNENFISICNGVSEMENYPVHRVYKDCQTFITRIAHYCRSPEIKRSNFGTKKKLFDALLGKDDGRRSTILKCLKENALLDQSLINFYHDNGQDTVRTIFRSSDLDNYEDTKLIGVRHGSAKFLDDLDNGKSMSPSIPQRIYDNCWYSLVAETNSGTQFITEKTAKCLLAGRIFVMFGHEGMLAKLKDYGYKTFDTIIDESYDDEPDNDKRMSMAFKQATKLARINDHDEMYNKVHEILRHNQNLCKDHQSRLTGVRDFVGAHLQYRRLMK